MPLAGNGRILYEWVTTNAISTASLGSLLHSPCMDARYNLTTTCNTKRFNASLSTSQKPRAYANDADLGRKRPLAHAEEDRLAELSLPTKKPRATLNLLSHNRVSPAGLARSARAEKGLATRSPRHRPRSAEKPQTEDNDIEMRGEGSGMQEESHDDGPQTQVEETHNHPDGIFPAPLDIQSSRTLDPVLPSSYLEVDTSALQSADVQTFPHVNPDDLATWNGMPLPPSRIKDATRPSTTRLPEMRTSDGKVRYSYVAQVMLLLMLCS